MTDTLEVVCSTEASEFKYQFEWTENIISCFGVYAVYCKKLGWCNCIECFKKRYLAAIKKVVPENFKEDCDLNSAIINLMKY